MKSAVKTATKNAILIALLLGVVGLWATAPQGCTGDNVNLRCVDR